MKATYPLGSTSKYSRRYVAIILIFMCLILSWYGYHHYFDFKLHQSNLMMQSVEGASSEITAEIAELQRVVTVFANQHTELISALTHNPEDEENYEKLKEILAVRFPNYFAFTIADKQGEPLLGNYDLLVNELCQRNLHKFATHNYIYDIFIHPHPSTYHFDIITALEIESENHLKNNTGVFFISIRPNTIARILKNAEVHEHELFLLKNDVPNLIEVSSQGSRIDIPGLEGDFFINPEQIKRIGYTKPVTGTLWNLVDIPYAELMSNYRNEIILQTTFIMIGFIFISFIFLGLARREEIIRLHSELALENMKDRLEQALLFSKVGMWEFNIANKTFNWSDRASEIFHHMEPKTFNQFIDLISDEHQDTVRQSFDNCINSGITHRTEHKIKVDGENPNWIEMTGNIKHDEGECENRMMGLIRDITIRKLAEENRISFEIQQKNTLIREVHHRIKNNLQGVVGLLRQHGKYESINNTMLDHAISQLNSVSLVHGIQGDESTQHIPVTQLVTIICKASLEIMAIKVEPTLESSSNIVHFINEKNAVPVALIVNELIFNATKHTKHVTKENIHIGISLSENSVVIKVQNDGATLPINFDFEKAKGLGTGLSLIKSLLPRQGAKLSIQDINYAVLCTFHLTFPVLLNREGVENENRNHQQITLPKTGHR